MAAAQTKVPACPMCRSRTRRLFATKHGSQYFRCRGCATTYADPRPSDEALVARLDQFAPASEGGIVPGWNEQVPQERGKVSLVGAFAPPPARLLDVGAGSGAFVAAAREAGYDAEGQDLSAALALAASRTFGITVHAGPLARVGGAYDVVTMWDTLEHAVDPRRELAESARLLLPGGHLVVFSPNGLGVSGRVLRGRWWVFGPTDHLVMFSADALTRALADVSLDRVHLDFRQLAPPYPPQEAASHPFAMKIFGAAAASAPFQKLLVDVGMGDWMYVVARRRDGAGSGARERS